MTDSAIERFWVERRLADRLYDRIIKNDGSLTVFFVEAPAGIGKTFLARDIGTRLGSPTGYEPSRQANIIWSGILDIYDSDTNSGSGVERRLIEALEAVGIGAGAFEDYYDRRATFDSWQRTGVVGASLEEFRRKVENAFADSLKGIAAKQRITLVFDTVERLERASDPTHQTFGYYSDTASVAGWLLDQIVQLRNGVVLLFGRHSPVFCNALQAAIARANSAERVNSPIEYHLELLSELDAAEMDQFFQKRIAQSPNLHKLLNADLQEQMTRTIGGNPLLLDIALLALQQTHAPDKAAQSLHDAAGLQELERALIAGYKNSLARPEQANVLHYLALARNGLSAELLSALEPRAGHELIAALKQMETSPFVKVRDITWTDPDRATATRRRVYFLHDAMYAIYDGAVLRPYEAQQETKRIVDVYERWIEQVQVSLRSFTNDSARETLKRVFEDLKVESLFYRMRSDPVQGYQWYLKQTDRAIRNSEIGYDMRLQNELDLFLVSAGIGDAGEVGESLRSSIDQANVAAQFPELVSHFRIDSASSLVKRMTARGKNRQAVDTGDAVLPSLETIFRTAPDTFRLAYAEFLLWLSQAVMYGLDNQRALTLYQQIADEILGGFQIDGAKPSTRVDNEFSFWRRTMVLGRTYNNMGYVNWLYLGRLTLAIQQLQHARALFLRTVHDDPSIEEELANASDNLGRVYVQLGRQFQSLRLIRNGLDIRERLGSNYRTALSQVSLAHAYVRLGDYEQGLLAAEKALIAFKRVDVQRGIGLGLLARGMLYRNRAENWRERNVSAQSALDDVDKAETDLRDAVRIFSNIVGEPIRAVEAHNELGCCYRARYLILQKGGGGSAEREFAYTQSRLQLREAIKVAEANSLDIERLDALQDLAVLHARAGQYEDALRYLQQVSNAIDQAYKIVEGEGLAKLGDDQRIDAYYKLMGQVKLLTGAIKYEQGRRRPNSEISEEDMPDNETIISSAREYLFAVTYFREYGEEDLALRQTYERIYKRFRYCQPELMQNITKQHIPAWVSQYNLPESLVIGLFQDVFPLLLD
jgi:tetratricopeptide (TPR) repeat protein